jgi:hypothetical protein
MLGRGFNQNLYSPIYRARAGQVCCYERMVVCAEYYHRSPAKRKKPEIKQTLRVSDHACYQFLRLSLRKERREPAPERQSLSTLCGGKPRSSPTRK